MFEAIRVFKREKYPSCVKLNLLLQSEKNQVLLWSLQKQIQTVSVLLHEIGRIR